MTRILTCGITTVKFTEMMLRIFHAHVYSAEERAKASESERLRSEGSRQTALKDLAKLQVSMEERIAETERTVTSQQHKK